MRRQKDDFVIIQCGAVLVNWDPYALTRNVLNLLTADFPQRIANKVSLLCWNPGPEPCSVI